MDTFLNRTNRSGILNAGPIGGYSQSGDWKLDVRFDKEALIAKIAIIAEHKQSITVYNKDIISLLRNYAPGFGGNVFFYFDPPYYNKGQKLYKNFFSHKDHQRIHDVIAQEIVAPWIITYDDVGEIAGLSIQHMSDNPEVGLEKGSASKTFAGVSDDTHDIFTNSAGEGNITRIILAVVSFKRLKEQYGRNYKGGILLIDELDATLYGFSQVKLVDYLWKAAKDYKIQIVFTTHSPIILKCVNKYQRKERLDKGIELPAFAYDSSIVYLEPKYDQEGMRTIMPKNISTSTELSQILNDINLSIPSGNSKINVYCEDTRAISFLQYVLSAALNINLDLYMTFIDINLGWTNYVQLAEKGVPEFKNNVIVLDGDVPQKREYRSKAQTIRDARNFIFLPLVIEEGVFRLLKDHGAFSRFQESFSRVPGFTYDVCFNSWPLEADRYNTDDFKHWYAQSENALGDQTVLFAFWCSEYHDEVAAFVENFIKTFNELAEKNAVDAIPPTTQNGSGEEDVNSPTG